MAESCCKTLLLKHSTHYAKTWKLKLPHITQTTWHEICFPQFSHCFSLNISANFLHCSPITATACLHRDRQPAMVQWARPAAPAGQPTLRRAGSSCSNQQHQLKTTDWNTLLTLSNHCSSLKKKYVLGFERGKRKKHRYINEQIRCTKYCLLLKLEAFYKRASYHTVP